MLVNSINIRIEIRRRLLSTLKVLKDLNPLSANLAKWSNTLKHFVGFCRLITWAWPFCGWRLKVLRIFQERASNVFYMKKFVGYRLDWNSTLQYFTLKLVEFFRKTGLQNYCEWLIQWNSYSFFQKLSGTFLEIFL